MGWFDRTYRVYSFRNDARAVGKGKVVKRLVRKGVYRKVGKWLR